MDELPENETELVSATDTSLRTKEELIAEIEARLSELEHADNAVMAPQTDTAVLPEQASSPFDTDIQAVPVTGQDSADESGDKSGFMPEKESEYMPSPEPLYGHDAESETELLYDTEAETESK